MANSIPSKDSQAPSGFAAAITPHDSTNFPDGECRAIYVGGAGNFTAIVGGVAVAFNGAVAGSVIPVRCTRVNSTDLTAANLVALY